MKNKILFFLLGMMLVINIAASTTNLIITRPEIPKITFTCIDKDLYSIRNTIEKKVSQGYIVKCITSTSSEYHENRYVLLVMEKY